MRRNITISADAHAAILTTVRAYLAGGKRLDQHTDHQTLYRIPHGLLPNRVVIHQWFENHLAVAFLPISHMMIRCN